MPNRQMICARCWGSRTEPGVDSITDVACSRCGGKGVEDDQPLSSHFMLSEGVVSETAARKRIPNDPSLEVVARMRQVAADCLEPIRAVFGPLHVNSFHRSAAVNEAIGGSPTSAHVPGWATDFVPITPGKTLKQIVDFLIASEIPFDQVIYEGTWVHVARFGPGGVVRRQALMMFGGHYSPYDPADPRVQG